jgi:serine/threonine protein kinase
MHRDLKLADILKNNGSRKIPDFGFSRLLTDNDLNSTMLGSSLIMVQKVLNGN